MHAIVDIWLTISSMVCWIFVIQLCRMPPVPSRPGNRCHAWAQFRALIKENGFAYGTECPGSVHPVKSLVKIIKWLKSKEKPNLDSNSSLNVTPEFSLLLVFKQHCHMSSDNVRTKSSSHSRLVIFHRLIRFECQINRVLTIGTRLLIIISHRTGQ